MKIKAQVLAMFAVPLLMPLVAWWATSLRNAPNHLIVVNQSGQPIKSLRLDMDSAPDLLPVIKFDFAAAKTTGLNHLPNSGQCYPFTPDTFDQVTKRRCVLPQWPLFGQDKRPLFLKVLPLGRWPGRRRSGRADSFIVGSHAIIPPRVYPLTALATA